MALPGTLNLDCIAGDDFSYVVDLEIADATGYTFEAEIVSAVTGEQVEEFTATPTGDPVTQVTLELTNSETAAIARGSYLWRLIMTSAESIRTTPFEEIFEVG